MDSGNDSPVKQLSKLLQQDDDYAWAWQCNLAVCAMDEGVRYDIANRAAARFMRLAFDVDITQNPRFDACLAVFHEQSKVPVDLDLPPLVVKSTSDDAVNPSRVLFEAICITDEKKQKSDDTEN